jgi:LacI family repressor for deo operon, udp, cdd, tsx, nupC, and nupG
MKTPFVSQAKTGNKVAKNITIADIAKAAGVSKGTVSRVLNNRDGDIPISEKTREKVEEVAKELGYQPNPFAAALRSQRTGVIGAVIRDISDPFLILIMKAIQKTLHAKNLELLIGHAEYESETAERQFNLLLNRWSDGLLLLGNLPGDQTILSNLKKYNTPIVAIAGNISDMIPSVDFNNVTGTRAALNYLYELGHRRIAFIGNQEHAGVRERLAVFKEFLAEHSLSIWEEYIKTNPKTRGEALSCTRSLLSLPKSPTAIFCASDLLALGAMNGAWQMGLAVPKDISIIGYDDIEEAADSYPPLTTIRQPAGAISNAAVELLLELIGNPNGMDLNTKVSIHPELIIRSSCAAPKRSE